MQLGAADRFTRVFLVKPGRVAGGARISAQRHPIQFTYAWQPNTHTDEAPDGTVECRELVDQARRAAR